MNLAAIRTGLTTNITAVVTDAIMTGYLVTPPTDVCFEIDTITNTEITFSRGLDEIELVVRGIIKAGEPDEAQKRIDNWLDGTGGESVKAAIETDKTLGGACDTCRVTSWRGPLRFGADPNTLWLCAEWTVQIYGTPS